LGIETKRKGLHNGKRVIGSQRFGVEHVEAIPDTGMGEPSTTTRLSARPAGRSGGEVLRGAEALEQA
jgi:hypothetical protein